MNIFIDTLISIIILLAIFGERLFDLLDIMKFRIVERHNGREYFYIVQKRWLFFWYIPEHGPLDRSFNNCKEADLAIDNYILSMTTNTVILERQ